MAALSYAEQVQQAYLAYYGRPADPAGQQYWVNQLTAANGNLNSIINAFGNSAESTALYGGSSTAAQVNAIYQTLFGRAADVTGLNFYVNGIVSGQFTLASVALNIYNGATGTDATELTAKLGYADSFTAALSQSVAGQVAYSGNAAVSNARAAVASVVDSTSQATATAALSTTIANIGTGTVAQTFTLTTGADTLAPAGNIAINGFSAAGANANTDTLTSADVIQGSGKGNVLNVTNTAATADATAGAQISGIQTVNIRNTAATTTASNLDASKVTGLTAVNSNQGTGDLVVTNLGSGASAGIIGNGTVANGTLNFGYAAAAGSKGTATLNLANGVVGTNSAVVLNESAGTANETSLVINSTGAANAIKSLDLKGTGAAGVTALTINAASNLDLGTGASNFASGATVAVSGAASSVKLGTAALENTIKSVDASGLTVGGITATLNTAAPTGFTLKGGAGADTITVTGAFTNTVAAGAIDGGAGTDTLIVSTAALTSATGADFVNFEVLQNAVAGTQDASVVAGITTLQANASGAGFSKMTAGQAANVQVLQSDATATFALKDSSGTSDVLGLTLQNALPANAATVINATALTVDGFETLNVAANSGLQSIYSSGTALGTIDSVSFAASATPSVKSVVATGSYAINIDASASGASKVTLIDVSADTAGAVITTGGQTGALVVNGSAAADVINVGAMGTAGSQTINAGAGNDVIKGTYADLLAATSINGGAGTDTLNLTDATLTINDNLFKNVTGVEKVVYSSATQVTHVVGGYANALAAANGGVLDITASALTDAAASSIDASGLSSGNSLKLSATVTAGAAHTGSLAITGSSGADNITVVSSGVGNAAAITISDSVGTASKMIDLSGVTVSGAVSVTTGAGADTIKGGAVAETITAGAGADTVTLLAGHATAQTLNYATGDSTASAMDLVSNFAKATDIISFTADNTTVVGNGSFTALQTGIANLTASVTGGVVTFGGSAATGLTAANAIAAVSALESTDGQAAAFVLGGNTYVVEHHGATTNVVELVGVSSVASVTASGATHNITLS
ncbi:DUF4214 domain-containing protein [Paraburkholderia sediminicola]|uniref:DUF4214 domain-containing protein n=1 Tax=Paraburkholderia sediminicola TaxID=458836 RepID=UPI0038BD4050